MLGVFMHGFFWVLYGFINSTCADGNLEWVEPTTGDGTDFGNDWCVCVLCSVFLCVFFGGCSMTLSIRQMRMGILSGRGLRLAMSQISVMIGVYE